MRIGWVGPPALLRRLLDEVTEKQALATATEGAERSTGAGMAAEARTEQRIGSVADTILSVAAEVDAEAILLGTRGRDGLKSLLLGGVSGAVVHLADRPVLVVPSANSPPNALACGTDPRGLWVG